MNNQNDWMIMEIFKIVNSSVYSNYTNYSTSTAHPPMSWIWSDYLRAVIFGSITFCTIIGNGLVLLSVSTRRNLRSPTHIFVANLAVADFLVGFFVLPFLATYQLTNTWYFGHLYCTVWVCIHFWLCSASILSVCAICLERYVGVSYPLQHYLYMCKRRVGVIIMVVWILACCLSMIPIFAWPQPQDIDPWVCTPNQQIGHVIVASVGILYIPTGIMIILYWKIYRTAAAHISSIKRGVKPNSDDNNSPELRIHVGSNGNGQRRGSHLLDDGTSSETTENTSTSTIEVCGNVNNSSQENLTVINYKKQARTAKKLAVVVGAFILSYVPFFTLFLIRAWDMDFVSNEVFNIFGLIRYFNSCLNPMIYAAMLPTFRKAFKEILICKVRFGSSS